MKICELCRINTTVMANHKCIINRNPAVYVQYM